LSEACGALWRVAVTGCAGFIGSHVAAALRLSGASIVCIDNLSRAGWYPLLLLRYHGIRVEAVDVRDYDAVVRLLDGVDAVVHTAAYISVPESVQKPSLYASNNVNATASLLEAVRDSGVEALVYTSSAAVYGEPSRIPITEDHPVRPVNPYGLFKACEEQLIRMLSAGYGYRYMILRLFNVYGPGQSRGYAGVVERFAEAFTSGEPVTIYGDGTQTRDFIHVYDVSAAVIASLKALLGGTAGNETLNIASGRETSIKTLYRVFEELTARQPPVIHAPPRPGDVARSVASVEKAWRVIGFRSSMGLREGLSTVLAYHTDPIGLLIRSPAPLPGTSSAR